MLNPVLCNLILQLTPCPLTKLEKLHVSPVELDHQLEYLCQKQMIIPLVDEEGFVVGYH